MLRKHPEVEFGWQENKHAKHGSFFPKYIESSYKIFSWKLDHLMAKGHPPSNRFLQFPRESEELLFKTKFLAER